MTARAWWLPAVVGLASLAAGAVVTLFLHATAARAVETVLAKRLEAAGAAAAALLPPDADDAALARLAKANGLDGAQVVTPALLVRAGSQGGDGRRVDLLRVDPQRVKAASQGQAYVGPGYQLDSLEVVVGYAPLPAGDVLVLEAGETFRGGSLAALDRGRAAGLAASLLTALLLALVTAQLSSSERARAQTEQRALRGEALKRLAAVAAHEIRNPLSTIRGTAELMGERLEAAFGPKDRQALADIVDEVDRVRGLTDELLELAGERALLKSEVRLDTLLAQVAEQAQRGFPGLTAVVRAPAEVSLEADEARLRQVFVNLLSNAAQARADATVTVEVTAERSEAVVRVRDDGPGIPESERAQLFEPFFTTRDTGTGLGLAVSRRLVERHGGTLELEGGGPGACFVVRLPRGK